MQPRVLEPAAVRSGSTPSPSCSSSRGVPLPPAMAQLAYSISLPRADARELELDQDAEWCTLESPDSPPRRIRFHDYNEIYAIPGLYERLFHDHLQCRSPQVIRELLEGALQQQGASPQQLRVLDVGAGNGIVGEQLHGLGARHIVGVDIMPEARAAALRDRPGIYNEYLVLDLTDPTPEQDASLRSASFNAITCVAALGFGDMPPQALARALEYVTTGGYVALTLKNRFLEDSGFNLLLRALLRDKVFSPLMRRTYCHRLSVAGDPLQYHAIVAEKRGPIPAELLRQFQVL